MLNSFSAPGRRAVALTLGLALLSAVAAFSQGRQPAFFEETWKLLVEMKWVSGPPRLDQITDPNVRIALAYREVLTGRLTPQDFYKEMSKVDLGGRQFRAPDTSPSSRPGGLPCFAARSSHSMPVAMLWGTPAPDKYAWPIARWTTGTAPAAGAGSSAGPPNLTGGVMIVGQEKGNRPGYFAVEPIIRNALVMSGSRIRELPPNAPFPANAATEPKKALAALRPLNIGWLLYVEVQIHWSRFTFAPDVVTVRCFDPSGQQHWKEETSNRFADSAEHSLRIVAGKIAQRLEKRRGQACLRP